MNKATIIAIVIVIILIAVVGIWYGVSRKPAETIKIGAILPLTGKAASYGQDAREALEMALEEINTKGIKGRKVEIIYEDSQGQPAIGVSAIKKLITVDKVPVVIGAVMSSVTLSMAPVAEENKVVLLTMSSAPAITDAGDFIFRNRETANDQGKKMAEVIFGNLKANRAALLFENSDTGNSHSSAFKKYFQEIGGEIVSEETYDTGTSDFKAQLTKIKAKNPEVVYLAPKPKDCGLILKQAKELGIETQFTGTSGCYGQEVIDIAQKAAEGLIQVMYAYPGELGEEKQDPAYQAFEEAYQEKYGRKPTALAALHYDNFKIITGIMKKIKDPTDSTQIKEKLYEIQNYVGASGTTTFDENGDAKKPLMLRIIKNGQFVPYEE